MVPSAPPLPRVVLIALLGLGSSIIIEYRYLFTSILLAMSSGICFINMIVWHVFRSMNSILTADSSARSRVAVPRAQQQRSSKLQGEVMSHRLVGRRKNMRERM